MYLFADVPADADADAATDPVARGDAAADPLDSGEEVAVVFAAWLHAANVRRENAMRGRNFFMET